MSRLNTMYPDDEFLKNISDMMGKFDNKNETEIKQEIEQIGYKEFYRYYKEKNVYIKQLQQENQKYKEVIFKIKMIISSRIKEYQKKIDNEIDMGSQGDHFKICRYEENIKFLKDILKEVE